jgi:predicted permease
LPIFNTLLPVFAIIILGGILARAGFLSRGFLKEALRLAYYVALPALIFQSVSQSSYSSERPLIVFGVIVSGTLVTVAMAYLVAALIRLPFREHGTFVHAAYRGNLAFMGLPIIIYSYGGVQAAAESGMVQLAVLSLTPMIIFNNIAGVLVLSASQHRVSFKVLRPVLKSLSTNPFFLSSVAGLLFAFTGLSLPSGMDRTLGSVGQIGVPIALLCVGGTLVTTRIRDRIAPSFAASLIKVVITPLAGWLIARAIGLGPDEMRIAMIFLAAPAAAGAFVMTIQMGGDPALASASIAISTALSTIGFTVVLALF